MTIFQSLIVSTIFIQTVTPNLFHLKSDPQCVRENCPIEDYFRYYSCNLEQHRCDFHLQVREIALDLCNKNVFKPWVFAIVAFVTISFLLTVVCTLLNCICCVERGR
ncbi:hypothetical protein M3Y96_00085500 [Aphelenchoides besseyi]|nr:hypothetical protein M3Y96_00085500 [Aphelenchoides besseyi]